MHKRKKYTAGLFLLALFTSVAAIAQKNIREKDAQLLVSKLASDEMQGRKVYSPGIEKAADFIAAEFGKAKLQPFPDLTGYRQSFSVIKSKQTFAEGLINDSVVNEAKIIAFTSKEILEADHRSGYQVVSIDSADNLIKEARELLASKRNYLVLVNEAHTKNFTRLNRLKREQFKKNNHFIFLLGNTRPTTFRFRITHEIAEDTLSNIAGMLLGKSKPEEFVIFSAHYDHLGIGKPNEAMDSVFNGANDDASGTAAVIMLAKYFSEQNNNERSIIFVAFTAEESGGFGSTYFSTQINPDKVAAMFNIEMIGTESKWGTNSAYITGYEKSDFGKILQQNLQGSDFHFEPDPYPQQKLFYRSDNATLAALGVPAHTISTSKMDAEPHYHTVEDEITTLDFKNMAAIIKAIARSSQSIIKGTDSPTRVEQE